MRRAAPRAGVNAGVPVAAMQTYSLIRPAGSSWWRPATCEEIDCAPYLYGWRTSVDQMTPLGNHQARYIRLESGRKFSEHFDETTGLTVFEFVAGQPCFAAGSHRRAVEREPLYVVRGGDHRGNPLNRRRIHDAGEHWVEDFAENQDKIQTVRERG